MRLPKLLRKLWMPLIAILILALIATIELREPFVAAGPGRIPRPPKAPAARPMEQQAATDMSRQGEPPNTIRNSTTGSIIPERRSAKTI